MKGLFNQARLLLSALLFTPCRFATTSRGSGFKFGVGFHFTQPGNQGWRSRFALCHLFLLFRPGSAIHESNTCWCSLSDF